MPPSRSGRDEPLGTVTPARALAGWPGAAAEFKTAQRIRRACEAPNRPVQPPSGVATGLAAAKIDASGP
nr:hypothetical protein GCM10025699_48350 [Microbacterium flavescens]